MTNATPQNKNTATIVVLALIYLVLIAFSLYGSYKFTDWSAKDRLKDYAGLVGICFTASSAVMGLIVSFVTLQKNQRAASDLERLKSDLQGDVFWKKIWTDARFEFEKIKTANTNTAYVKLWTSADMAYKALAKLETGNWKSEDRTQMDVSLLEAHSQLIFVREQDHEILWEKVRQRARYLSEKAAGIQPSQQPKLWQENVAEFSAMYEQFKNTAYEEMNRPPKPEEQIA